jgi:purine-binding chemotaxis protein CheW
VRIRFGNHSPTCNDQTIVIVLNVLGRVMGMVVDGVSDVVEITAEDIMPPQLGTAALTEHIVGVASHDERMLIVLNIERALSNEDARQLDLAAMVRPG